MSAAVGAFAKKFAQNQGRALALQAQNKAKKYAANKARQVANAAKRRANAGISTLVQKHLGNNAQSRALANKLKAHVANRINTANKMTQNQIKKAPSFF
jgi:hypothetical protein